MRWAPVAIAVAIVAGFALAGSNGVGTGGLQGFPTINGTGISPSSVTSPVGNFGVVDAGEVIIGGAGKWRFSVSNDDLLLTFPGNNPTLWRDTTGGLEQPYHFLVSGTASNQFICNAASGNNCMQVATEGARSQVGPDTYWAESGTSMVATAAGGVNLNVNAQTCTLDGASPSKCSVTVRASAKCQCTPIGTTAAAAAAGCAVNLVTTTLTAYSANGLTNDVNIWCDR